jgi:DNA-binding NtrC family response regulator
MTFSRLPVLLVDDEKQILLSFQVMLRANGLDNIFTIDDSRNVLPFLAEKEISLIVLDLNMPHVSGIELLDRIRNDYPSVSVIIVTAVNDLDNAVECMKRGAVDYLVKPVEKSRFLASIQNALKLCDLRAEISSLRHHITLLRQHYFTDELENEAAFSSILASSKKMRAVFRYVEAVSGSSEPVLIMGETGVGKELIARAIHKISGVKGELVAVNAAGLDDTMFSDTLFGHKKGAFTGAHSDRDGLIVKAKGGTIFLDEIGDLNEVSQVKLLRLLEEGIYYPLGSDTLRKSNARVIASTNRDLQKSMTAGEFRKDLYYRIAALQVQIPPLRERIEDIPLLLDHFLEYSAESLYKNKPTPPPELIPLLSNYFFPGNVRELKAMVFDAVTQHKSGVLSLDRFKDFIKNRGEQVKSEFSIKNNKAGLTLDISGRFPTIKEVETYLTSEAMKRSNNNQGIAASLLGITRHALNKRLKRKDQDVQFS